VVAVDAFVDLLQDALTFFSGNALHEYSRRCALPVELVSDLDVGLGMVDELLGMVLVQGNLLLVEVVDEGLPPVRVYHHDLLASWGCAGSVVGGAGFGMDGARSSWTKTPAGT
jgi:hypothetical protein